MLLKNGARQRNSDCIFSTPNNLRNSQNYASNKIFVESVFCRLHLFLSSASSFSSQYLLFFLKSLGAVFFFFLLLFLPSSVLQWHHEGGDFFSEYNRSNLLFYVGYYLEVSCSLLYGQELVHQLLSLTILSSPFSSSTTFQRSPNTSALIFLVIIINKIFNKL